MAIRTSGSGNRLDKKPIGRAAQTRSPTENCNPHFRHTLGGLERCCENIGYALPPASNCKHGTKTAMSVCWQNGDQSSTSSNQSQNRQSRTVRPVDNEHKNEA
ncbi:unnamed protein product [Soboliphyme baturini]|uniref:Uncharacterized protein n=1 Tax=Soboliphyme baturini TaxID=241478 RepID=A0A183J3B8_9BILA|nr:unnamed protein product [Soboliphyme baturini]